MQIPSALTLPLLLAVPLATSLGACSDPVTDGGAAQDPAVCMTLECASAAAVQDYARDPRGVTARVAAMPDELERMVVVNALVAANVGATSDLCLTLPRGASQDRCLRLMDRPHLKVITATMPARTDVVAARPEWGFPEVTIPIPAKALDATLCPDTPGAGAAERPACLDAAAMRAAVVGDLALANAICGGHAEAKWADECRFNAAESAVTTLHSGGYATAAALCGNAPTFRQECWSHIVTEVPDEIPPPTGTRAQADKAIAQAQAVERAWINVSPEAAARHVDRYWAAFFATSYSLSPAPDGTPLEFYPEVAWPAIRGAAAMRLAALGLLGGTFAEQQGQVKERLAARSEPVLSPTVRSGLTMVTVLGAPPDTVPRVFFLGPASRPWSEDAAIDIALCVLQVDARANPPDYASLREAVKSKDPLLSAEATRLMAELATLYGPARGG